MSADSKNIRQAAVAVATGSYAETLDHTFTSFAINPFLELHAVVIGDKLPDRQLPGIHYHLRAPDPAYHHPMREIYYRRFLFLDELGADYAVVVDNHDVLCMQPLPELPMLLRGAAFGACVEHAGSRYIEGQGYTSNYFNAGVTFWDVKASQAIRADIAARGRARFRSVEDQLTLNEVVNTKYYDQIVVLPCQYNYRPCLAPKKLRNWPTVNHLNGISIYHNVHCIEAARCLIPSQAKAILEDLPQDKGSITPLQQFWRKVQLRFRRHYVR
jgi:lipopolysaccharide biosynthesis glycosyltransferase